MERFPPHLLPRALHAIRAAVAGLKSAPEGRFRPAALASAAGWKLVTFPAHFEKFASFVEVKMRLMHGLRLPFR
jgi:hypothetical protein